MSRMFGTDGVRGVANEELTPLLAMQLGQAGAYVLTRENKHKPTIMVGCDTRSLLEDLQKLYLLGFQPLALLLLGRIPNHKRRIRISS